MTAIKKQDVDPTAGLPFPWKFLNDATDGLHPGLTVIYGAPKSMKSWAAIAMAEHALSVSKAKVAFYSREMPTSAVATRFASQFARIDPRDLLKTVVAKEVKSKILSHLEDVTARQHDFTLHILSDRGEPEAGTVAWLRSKVLALKPDVLFVDGMYLLRSNAKGDLKAVASDLRALGIELNIPIVCTTPSGRRFEEIPLFADVADLLLLVRKQTVPEVPPQKVEETVGWFERVLRRLGLRSAPKTAEITPWPQIEKDFTVTIAAPKRGWVSGDVLSVPPTAEIRYLRRPKSETV
jgi:hypothetical protein